MADRLWLDYYNRYLLEHGVISQQTYFRMAEQIRKKHPTPKGTA